jgi:hypothetical protein
MGRKIKDISGLRFGRLIAVEIVGITKKQERIWKCKCDCGNETEVTVVRLMNGTTKSCGCIQKELSSKRAKTGISKIHGYHGTRVYICYKSMMERCCNPNNRAYKNYGGRGIKICDEWMHNPKAFIDWALNNGYKDNLTIERINVNGNYEPSNCKWATIKQQNNNRRSNKFITINNETKTLQEWADYVGILSSTINRRINKGWDYERAVFTPVETRFRRAVL